MLFRPRKSERPPEESQWWNEDPLYLVAAVRSLDSEVVPVV